MFLLTSCYRRPRDLIGSLVAAFLLVISATSVVNGQASLPPAPAPMGTETPSPSGMPAPTPNTKRAAELWDDKPLGHLKASISKDLAEHEQLSQPEVVRLTQATSVLAAHGNLFSAIGDSRPWMLATYDWEAPATRHLPLYFEEPNLERLGYRFAVRTGYCGEDTLVVSDCVQPFISAAHFFGRLPLAPYLGGLDDSFEPIYTLGVDRPGSPVPYRRHYIPLSLQGALYQAGATVGLLYVLP